MTAASRSRLKPTIMGSLPGQGTCVGGKHLRGQKAKNEDNPLWKHDWVHHGGIQGLYSMKVLRSHKTPLSRQLQEATEIELSTAKIILNSRSEYNGQRVPRVMVEVCGRVEVQEYRGSGLTATWGLGAQVTGSKPSMPQLGTPPP